MVNPLFPSNETGDAPPSTATMTDLGEALLGPDGPKIAGDLLARIRFLGGNIMQEMRDGTSPDRFAALEAVKNALDQAEKIMLGLATDQQAGGSSAQLLSRESDA